MPNRSQNLAHVSQPIAAGDLSQFAIPKYKMSVVIVEAIEVE